jgi:hypothetical protein
VTCLMWNLILVRLEIVLVSEQNRCTVCAKFTIGSDIVLDACELLCDVGHVQSRFGPFGDSVNLDAR